MREPLGDFIAIFGVSIAIYFLLKKKIEWPAFSAMSMSCVVLGIAVSAMPRITQFNLKGENVGEVSVRMQEQVEHVDTKAMEVEDLASGVKQMREEMTLLLQNANTTNDKITNSEKRVGSLVARADSTEKSINKVKADVETSLKAAQSVQASVATVDSNVKVMFRSVFSSIAYALMARNIFPIPQPIGQKIDLHLNRLATFAILDETERNALFGEIRADVQGARPQLPLRPRLDKK